MGGNPTVKSNSCVERFGETKQLVHIVFITTCSRCICLFDVNDYVTEMVNYHFTNGYTIRDIYSSQVSSTSSYLNSTPSISGKKNQTRICLAESAWYWYHAIATYSTINQLCIRTILNAKSKSGLNDNVQGP